MQEGGASTWREVVERHHNALVDELSERLDSDLREAMDVAVSAERAKAATELKRACEEARGSQSETLNRFLRRLRATSEVRVPELVAESCAAHAEKLVVLVFENDQARSAASFGITNGGVRNGTFENPVLLLDTNTAPAVVTAIESRDPVVALATETEISPVLAAAFSPVPDGKAYLFPVIARHSVVAMLIASGVLVSSPIELLCEAAGMRLEASEQRLAGSVPKLPAQSLVTLGPVTPAGDTSEPHSTSGTHSRDEPRSWDELAPEDQKLHLQAQRMARVRVAEMRLYHESELRSGVAAGDIYDSLRNEVDAARNQFLQTFLSKSPTMVDYLHLEILRSLAHDDDRLLGQSYPGPMV
jgi:hypothetical protein